MSIFKPAERKKVRFKLAITGPSGAGKTFSALKIAKGMTTGKIALIDTEAGSASLYAGSKGIPAFDTIELDPPFTTERYIELINAAVREGYELLIIDSISHQWQGEGSILDRKEKEQLAKPGTNGFTLFSKYTPEHEKFKQALIQSDIHLIATMRSKTDHIIEQNDKGRMAPREVGLAPIQREGIIYEFSTVIDLNKDHIATVSKDRTGLFDGQFFKPTEETGKGIIDWMMTGKIVWFFGQKEKNELRELMNSFASGKQIVKDWELKNGSFSSINEEQFNLLVQQLSAAKEFSEPSAPPIEPGDDGKGQSWGGT